MSARLVASLTVMSLLVAACAVDGADPSVQVEDEAPPTTLDPDAPRPAVGVLPQGPSALADMRHPDFPEPLVDPSDIISGGPPPDGIPSIDRPQFVSVAEADEWLEDAEPVVYVEIDGEARAYPVQILMWHEIVNDTIARVPVAVTYCPLCNSAVSYRRVVDGVEVTFGTSGRLFASALVMYDRATESLWTHFDGRAVVGLLTGERLEAIPSPLISWADFMRAFPGGLVLDRDATGHDRPYGRNPYFGYDDPQTRPFLFRGDADDRALAKQRVVGVEIDGEARAWTLELLSGGEARATNTAVGDTPLVILWKAGQASALEVETVSGGRDVGSVGVFSPVLNGQRLTFTARGDGFFDEETGSEWTVTGAAVDGPLAGSRLDQLHHLDTFWFAWATYMPETDLVED